MVLYKHNRCTCFVNLAVRASDLSFKVIQHCVFSFKCQMEWFSDGLEILNMTHDGVSCSAVSHSGWLSWSNSIFVCATGSQRSQTAEAWQEPLFPSSGSVVPMGLMFLRQSRPSYDQQDLQNIMRAQVTQCQQELSLDQLLSLNMMNMLHSWPVWVFFLFCWAFLKGKSDSI